MFFFYINITVSACLIIVSCCRLRNSSIIPIDVNSIIEVYTHVNLARTLKTMKSTTRIIVSLVSTQFVEYFNNTNVFKYTFFSS